MSRLQLPPDREELSHVHENIPDAFHTISDPYGGPHLFRRLKALPCGFYLPGQLHFYQRPTFGIPGIGIFLTAQGRLRRRTFLSHRLCDAFRREDSSSRFSFSVLPSTRFGQLFLCSPEHLNSRVATLRNSQKKTFVPLLGNKIRGNPRRLFVASTVNQTQNTSHYANHDESRSE